MSAPLIASYQTSAANYSEAITCLVLGSIILKMPVAVRIKEKNEFVISPNITEAEKIVYEIEQQKTAKGPWLQLNQGIHLSEDDEKVYAFVYRFSILNQKTNQEICFYFFSTHIQRISAEKKKVISELSRLIARSISSDLPDSNTGINLHTMQPQFASAEGLPWFNKK